MPAGIIPSVVKEGARQAIMPVMFRSGMWSLRFRSPDADRDGLGAFMKMTGSSSSEITSGSESEELDPDVSATAAASASAGLVTSGWPASARSRASAKGPQADGAQAVLAFLHRSCTMLIGICSLDLWYFSAIAGEVLCICSSISVLLRPSRPARSIMVTLAERQVAWLAKA